MSDDANTDPPLPGHAPWADADMPQAEFNDHGPMPGEPATDAKIVVKDTGTALRERLVLTAADANATLVASKAQPTSRTVTISNALLDADDKVVTDAEGQPLLSTRHELLLTNDQLGRLGSKEAIDAAVLEARQQAAALADRQFAGAALFRDVLAGRVTPAPPVSPAPSTSPEKS